MGGTICSKLSGINGCLRQICDYLHSINISCHFDNLVKMSVSSYITVKTEKSVSYNLPNKWQTKSQQEQHVISYRAQWITAAKGQKCYSLFNGRSLEEKTKLNNPYCNPRVLFFQVFLGEPIHLFFLSFQVNAWIHSHTLSNIQTKFTVKSG